jgi:ATP-dependent DNA helicase RecG
LITSNCRITTREIAQKAKISSSTVEKNIKKLKQARLLKRLGPDRGGYWEVNLPNIEKEK